MVTKIQKWGNSQGLRIAKQVMEAADVAVGDSVDVNVRDGRIVISPVRQVRGKLSLRSLVSKIPRGYKAGEVSWGAPRGREAW